MYYESDIYSVELNYESGIYFVELTIFFADLIREKYFNLLQTQLFLPITNQVKFTRYANGFRSLFSLNFQSSVSQGL